MKKHSIKVVRNVWGNYVCFIGTFNYGSFSEEFDAKMWLAQKLITGNYVVSKKSDIKQQDVEEYKKLV